VTTFRQRAAGAPLRDVKIIGPHVAKCILLFANPKCFIHAACGGSRRRGGGARWRADQRWPTNACLPHMLTMSVMACFASPLGAARATLKGCREGQWCRTGRQPCPPRSGRTAGPVLSRRRRAIAATFDPLAHPRSDRRPVLSAPRVCFCDIDGTTTGSNNQVVPANVAAIAALPYPRVKFIPATGKSRAGAVAALGKTLKVLLDARYPGGLPGVYLQGLVCYGEDGALIHEQTLPPAMCARVAALAKQLDISLIAYARDGDSILCEESDAEIAKVVDFHEPVPEEIGDWSSVIGNTSIHKFLFMAPEERISAVRPVIESALRGEAEVTKATEGMLEVLPPGASKAAGVRRLREALGVDAAECLAIGDGENDEQMLREAGISIAVANAVPRAAAVATYRTASNDDGGLAAALDRFVFQLL
jgi:Cof subfamily protein (haloacid dehalogenase superfamily)